MSANDKERAKGLRSRRAAKLTGRLTPPGDKSISHRALMLAVLAAGRTQIDGLLESDDVTATANALRAFGAAIERTGSGRFVVRGCGVHGLAQPGDVIDMGNSGTGARLLAGLAAAHPFATHLTGDASLRRRPMGRIMDPLAAMGAQFIGAGNRLPMTIIGAEPLLSIDYEVPVPSAQVKSAVLLAALHAKGISTVVEAVPTRDHTETMLRHFGAEIEVAQAKGGGRRIEITGAGELIAADLRVPGDASSAAFAAAAAAIVPGSRVEIAGVGTNPLRAGFYRTLEEMGADLAWAGARAQGGEPVADLTVTGGGLRGVEVPASRAASMIDEYPILAMVAACAEGPTTMHGVGELRVKESDRLAGLVAGLAACGVEIEAGDESLVVHGTGTPPRGGAEIATELDHRIAMSFLVLGLATDEPVTIDNARPIATSYPEFVTDMTALGADISPAD
ncbi:MAG: 3-phosphoshikimate 1-carboxyvinyltransferase [Alphaproteobacteria bacterium]|nr:3-phosphoshikimate 1-carboxyvinyltransferase [Alphaproteobacteria bacterium]